MIPKGSYVRNVMSPVALMGTATIGQFRNGRQEYWFTPDPRILAGFRDTFSVPEGDLVLYSRPTSDEIEEINSRLSSELLQPMGGSGFLTKLGASPNR
jgi:hypothetical protein